MDLKKEMTPEEFQEFVIARLAHMDTAMMTILDMQFTIMKKMGVDQVEIKRLLKKVVKDSARFVDFYDLTDDSGLL